MEKKYLNPPDKYKCWNKKLILSKNNRIKTFGYCFRCSKKNYKKVYLLYNNSFFEDFKNIQIKDIIEVFRCFIDYIFNSIEVKNYLVNTKNIIISDPIIKKYIIK